MSRTSPMSMPRIWQAAQKERKVRLLGCEKYNMARLWASWLCKNFIPSSVLAMRRILVASEPRESN